MHRQEVGGKVCDAARDLMRLGAKDQRMVLAGLLRAEFRGTNPLIPTMKRSAGSSGFLLTVPPGDERSARCHLQLAD